MILALLAASGSAATGRFRPALALTLGASWLSSRRSGCRTWPVASRPPFDGRQPGSTGSSGSAPFSATPSRDSPCSASVQALPGRGSVAPRRPLGGRPRGRGRRVPRRGARPPESRRARPAEGGNGNDAPRTLDPVRVCQRAPDGASSARLEDAPTWWIHGVDIGGFHIAGIAPRGEHGELRRLAPRPRHHGAPRLPLLRGFFFFASRTLPPGRAGQGPERPRGLRRLPARRHQGEHPTTARSTSRSSERSSSSSPLEPLRPLLFLQPPTSNLNTTFALSLTCLVFFNAGGHQGARARSAT